MRIKISFKQVMLCTLCLIQPVFGMFRYGQDYEIVKTRYEERTRQAIYSLPTQALADYFNKLIYENNLTYTYIRQYSLGKNNILSILHQLGEVSFTFAFDANAQVALSCIVIDLLPKLFQNASKDPSFPRGKFCNIYNAMVCTYTYNDAPVPCQDNIDSPYLAKHPHILAQIIGIDLFLHPTRPA